jgi:putative glutamine amidotransferase
VKDLGAGLRVEARSAEDGLVEAIRLDGPTWVAGVQWHPEFAFTGPHSRSEAGADLHDDEPLLDAFLTASAERAG